MNRFNGLLNADGKKRYRSFISSAADEEKVCMLLDCKNYTIVEEHQSRLVWPSEEFARHYCDDKCVPVIIDVHDFCDMLICAADTRQRDFLVFHNRIDACPVSAVRLLEDIKAELDRVE